MVPRSEQQRILRQRQRLERLIELYLRQCYRKGTAARAGELAGFMGLDPSTLTRTVKRYLGVPPRVALRDRQIAEASRLLRATRLPVDNVGLRVGFGTRATFFRVFARATGCTPAAFRNKVKK